MQQPRSCLVSDYDHGDDHHNVYHNDDDDHDDDDDDVDDDDDDCSALLQSISNIYTIDWSMVIITPMIFVKE